MEKTKKYYILLVTGVLVKSDVEPRKDFNNVNKLHISEGYMGFCQDTHFGHRELPAPFNNMTINTSQIVCTWEHESFL